MSGDHRFQPGSHFLLCVVGLMGECYIWPAPGYRREEQEKTGGGEAWALASRVASLWLPWCWISCSLLCSLMLISTQCSYQCVYITTNRQCVCPDFLIFGDVVIKLAVRCSTKVFFRNQMPFIITRCSCSQMTALTAATICGFIRRDKFVYCQTTPWRWLLG